MARVVELWTVQMGKVNKARAQGIHVEDTTVKTGTKAFAPSWAIVMRHKKDGNDQAYINVYEEMMRQSWRENRHTWLQLLEHSKIALACYCRADSFCHRVLLAEMLQKVGAKFNIEVKLMGELK